MNTLLFLEKAQNELQDSALWYEQQSAGLGIQFVEVIQKKLDLVLQNPELFPSKKRNYREAVVKTFPFSIIYKFDKKENIVTIISVFHNSRNPKYKYSQRKK